MLARQGAKLQKPIPQRRIALAAQVSTAEHKLHANRMGLEAAQEEVKKLSELLVSQGEREARLRSELQELAVQEAAELSRK